MPDANLPLPLLLFLSHAGVDAEIQLALGRAVTDPSFRFIPILAPQAPGPEALPGFVALYQGVADVEERPDQFAKLVAAILGRDAAGTAKLEAEPFFGLKAIDEDRAHLFFGREQETETLIQLLSDEPLVMITGDSGSGKSSLARAGLIPRWRGGALAEAMGERPSGTLWHVVQTQPPNSALPGPGRGRRRGRQGLRRLP